MAIFYVRSTDGDNADDGSTWALAKATIAGALSAASAGDTIYVSDNHAESQATTITFTSPGTASSPCYILCVNDSAEPPTALTTTATVTITAASNQDIVFGAGYSYIYGITFSVGSAANTQSYRWNNTASGWNWKYRNCTFNLSSTSATALFDIGDASASLDDIQVIWKDCTVSFGSTSQKLQGNAPFYWEGGSLGAGTAIPTILFSGDAAQDGGGQLVQISGVDLSLASTGKTLINLARASPAFYNIRNCKLGSNVVIGTGAHVGPGGVIINMTNCDSADTNYRYWYQDYAGTIEHETTIVRTGGATDGTTPISREMISTANSSELYPLVLKDLVYWNESTGANTLTVHIVTDNVTLTDQECWLEVEYLGTSGFPLSSLTDDADSLADRLLGGSATNQATSTETWTTTGITTPVKQKLEVSFTPQEKGPIRCKVHLVKASTTVWVCPKIEVS